MMTVYVNSDGYEVFLVIDSILHEISSGGVRIAEDVTQEEVAALAREMTLKYAFFRLPRGGAKMGIRMPGNVSSEEKRRRLREIGARLGPIIRAGIYSPGMDMNCGPEDLQALYAGAGIRIGTPTDTSFFTALSVENALEACYAESGASGVLTIAVEGFGRVAGHLAARLSPERFRIVAISTLRGAVSSAAGFDGRLLADLRKETGDDLVHRVEGEPLSPADLLLQPVDILLPSTRTWVITPTVAEQLRARMIVPIANAPYADGVAAQLQERGVLCLPGFVTNAGGVFGSSLFDCGLSVERVVGLTCEHYRPMVRRLIQFAKAHGRTPIEAAEYVARRELESHSLTPPPAQGLFHKVRKRLAKRLPRRWAARKAETRFIQAMQSVSRQLASLPE